MHNPCPICDEPKAMAICVADGHEVFQCDDCLTFYISPMPSEEDLSKFYDNFYDNAQSGYFSKVDKKMKRAEGRIKALQHYVPKGRFLDIGCNGGFIAETARRHGFEATGIDLDPVSIDYAKSNYPNNSFLNITSEHLANRPERFDLIYCSEVVEHVPAPQSFAASIWALAKPNGIIFITTPDARHWSLPKPINTWDGFRPPEHLLYFNGKSLRRLFENEGFKFIKRRIAFKPGIKMFFRRPA